MTEEEQKCGGKTAVKSGDSFASSVMGLNNNLEFMGKQLHVQTEYTGFPVAGIVTQAFFKGRVVFSRRSDSSSNVLQAHDLGKIRALMHAQHYEVIQEITGKQTRIRQSR